MTTGPIKRSGFQVYVGPIVPASDRDRLQNLLKYLFRAPIALKHLCYDEATAQVTYSIPRGETRVWRHAYDFLSDFVQHLPAPRKPAITYHGWFANATGNLKSRRKTHEGDPTTPKCPRRSRWAQRVLRVWQTDPTACPRCGLPMTRSRALLKWPELKRVLGAIGLLGYPPRPPPVPPPDLIRADADAHPPGASGMDSPDYPDISQIPPGWEDEL